MEEIKKILEEILNIDLLGATLSNPRKKEEIVKYLKEAGQAWVEDASNQDDAFARNQIRNQVIPRLEMINEQAVEHIGWLCEDIKEGTTYLTDQIEESFLRCTKPIGQGFEINCYWKTIGSRNRF